MGTRFAVVCVQIPKSLHAIIMFTAKTRVDDKVAGFQLARTIISPNDSSCELTNRVEALLLRSARAREVMPVVTAHVIGFLGSKGGVGPRRWLERGGRPGQPDGVRRSESF